MNTRVAPWITLVLAAWLVSSPFVIGYGSVPAAVASDVVSGALIIVFSLGLAVTGSGTSVWALVVLSLWVIVSSFVLGYYRAIPATDASVNEGVTGAVIFLTAIIHAIVMRRKINTEM